MKALPLLAAVLALSACITVYPPDAPAANGAATARFGQTAKVGPLRVTPQTLIEDSRCPRGVSCVWAGQVRITATVTGAGPTRTPQLTSGKPISLGSGMLVLESVAPPAPAPGRKLGRADYRLTFRYTANIMPR